LPRQSRAGWPFAGAISRRLGEKSLPSDGQFWLISRFRPRTIS
jgi:hypothetical protein